MLRRPLALALAAGLAAVTAAVPTTAADAASQRITLTLRAAAPLSPLAVRPPLDAAERRERAEAVAPIGRARVQRWLTDHGFTVEATTGWTVTATGPAHLLTRRVPAELRPVVLSVVPDRATPMRPRAVPVGLSPEELRSAYDLPASDGGRGTTIATIQFSGWQASDAQVFARAAGIALAPGQITTHPVAGARADVSDGAGGDFEVALDVEAALGAAPAARQRVYVAPNTSTGAIAAYDAVAGAAEQLGLTAVSISWGACEHDTTPQLVAALEQSLARMVAAGATVFAASGDAGAYGCSAPGAPDSRLAVDYPASSPSVVAVGGTSLRRDGGRWVEVAWSDRRTAEGGYAGTGSGGGLSTLFARPGWQPGSGSRAVPDLAAVADPRTGIGIYGPDENGRRGWLVGGGTSGAAPLLAGQLATALSGVGRTAGVGRIHVPLYAAGRAGVGIRDVVSGDNLRHLAGPGFDLASGLGSPQWSALAPRLVEPAVMAAPATRDRSVDVTSYAPASRTARYGLAEGAEEACGQDLPAPPTALRLDGPDRVTAVVLAVREGQTCRTTSSPLVLDRTSPAVAAALGRGSRAGVLALSWQAAEPAPASGLASVSWLLRRIDTGEVVASGSSARSGSALRAVQPGLDYRLEVAATDAVGNRSPTAYSSDVTA